MSYYCRINVAYFTKTKYGYKQYRAILDNYHSLFYVVCDNRRANNTTYYTRDENMVSISRTGSIKQSTNKIE